jgi:hypothetical protein
MQRQKFEISNTQPSAGRVAGTDAMSRNHRKPLVGLSLMAALLLTVANAQEPNNSKPE